MGAPAPEVQGVFSHVFNLRAYPFDTQHLRVEAVLWHSPWEMALRNGGEEARAPLAAR